MIPYTLQLDLSGGKNPDGYFDVEITDIQERKKVPVDNNPLTERNVIGEITVRNMPFLNSMLFDYISSQTADNEFHIKLITPEETIYGYFGILDCDFDADKGIVRITPTTLDQYSDFLENRNKEVRCFEESNQIVNGDFQAYTNNLPNSSVFPSWSRSSNKLFLQRKYTGNKSAIGLKQNFYGLWDGVTPDLQDGVPQEFDIYISTVPNAFEFKGTIYYTGQPIYYVGNAWVPAPAIIYEYFENSISQSIENTIANNQIQLSFNYFLAGIDEELCDLSFRVQLYDPNNPEYRHYLKSDMTWTELLHYTSEPEPIIYQKSKLKIPITSFDKYLYYSKVTAPTPISGTIIIQFNQFKEVDNPNIDIWDTTSELIITDVVLAVPSIKLKTIKIQLSDENLVSLDQSSEDIFWNTKNRNDNYFRSLVRDRDNYNITNYFSLEGVPNIALLSDKDRGITGVGGVTYQNLQDFFADRLSKSYLFTMSELEVFRGTWRGGNKRHWYAIATYSREEVTTADIFDTESNQYLENRPAENAGWEVLEVLPNHRRKWGRIPFNDKDNQISWSLGATKSYPVIVNHTSGFSYYFSKKTVKNYPVTSSQNISVETAIDFKDLVRKVYTEMHESLRGKQVYSNFLWNDALSAEDENSVYGEHDTTTNYVTFAVNVLNRIAAIHTNDLSTQPPTDKDKTFMKIKWTDLWNAMKGLFPNLYIFIDSDKNLHIEHSKFFDKVNKIKVLNEGTYSYLKGYSQWRYLKEILFSSEEFEMENAGYSDFKTAEIEFAKVVSNKRNEDIKNQVSINGVSTDIRYCVESRDNLNNGIVLVAYDEVGDDNIVRYGIAEKSGSNVINGELSLSSLIKNYGTYEGTWIDGKLNGKDIKFLNNKRARQGEEISIKGIMPDKLVLTDLGIGVVKERTIDDQKRITKISVVYRDTDVYIAVGDDVLDQGQGNPSEIEYPSITTSHPLFITGNSAQLGGNVTSDGNDTVTERGVCWALTTNPTIDDNKIQIGSGKGEFSVMVGDVFSILTWYSVRAYAINSKGISYGANIRFKTTSLIS